MSSAHVDADFFDVLQAPLRAGRTFRPSEIGTDARVAIVNEEFVRRVLGGRNPIGRRVHYVYFEESDESFTGEEEPGPWYEIVGVAPDLALSRGHDPKAARLYHPLGSDQTATAIAIRVRGDPRALEPTLRAVAATVDPTLRVRDVVPHDELSAGELKFMDFWFRLTVFVSAMAIGLSLAGIYAVMSFTVARRTREIGVRVALGGSARRVVLAIFRRPLIQVALGVVAGVGLMGGLMGTSSGGVPLRVLAGLAAYAVLMFGVCMLACIVPTRRALRIEPTEALRAE